MKLLIVSVFLFGNFSLASIPKKHVVKRDSLSEIAFDQRAPLKIRWRALMAMTEEQGVSSQSFLKKALRSQEWFMRDAGLLAMERVNKNEALKWARKLIQDPALVVRTRSAKVLKRHANLKDHKMLWTELNHKRNFRNGQSLWVRRHIVDALARISEKDEAFKFVLLLDDKDKRVNTSAVLALEQIIGKRLGIQTEPLNHKVTYWKNWWKKNGARI